MVSPALVPVPFRRESDWIPCPENLGHLTLADSYAVAVELLGAAANRLNYDDPQDQAGWLVLLPHRRVL